MSAPTVLVSVRLAGGSYCARAGKGKDAKLASSTNCGPVAAQAAAAKYFGIEPSTADTITLQKSSPGVFLATLPEPSTGEAAS